MYHRSNIATYRKGGSITSVNLYFSKSRRHVDDTLHRHYKYEEDVDQLIRLGDLLWLGDKPGEQSDYYDPQRDWCVALGRDIDRYGLSAKIYGDLSEWLSDNRHCEFAYILDVEVWYGYTRYITERITENGLENCAYWVDEDGNQVSDFLPLMRPKLSN
jgi:hypothetical protein